MAKKGLLIILSGPSGVGKGTVRKAIMAKHKVRLTYSISMTTRAPRAKEVNGRDYYFVSKEEFQRNVFLEIEINGATQVLSKVKDDRVVSFFLKPPSIEQLENRIRKRKSETEEVIRERLEKGEKEMSMTEAYDYVILNDEIDRAAEEIISIIKEKQKA